MTLHSFNEKITKGRFELLLISKFGADISQCRHDRKTTLYYTIKHYPMGPDMTAPVHIGSWFSDGHGCIFTRAEEQVSLDVICKEEK